MAIYIVRFVDGEKTYYMEWSTVVDAPLTWGCDLDEFRDYYQVEYGMHGMRELPGRLAMADEHGCSGGREYRDGLLATNRAGKDEARLTEAEIVEWYCRRRVSPS